EVAIAEAGLRLEEFVADVVAEVEGVEDVLPVRPAEHKRLAVLLLPLEEFPLHAPPRIEVDVLDPPDVVDGVHVNAAPQRLTLDIADEMALVLTGINAVVRVQQFDLQHRGILASHGNRPQI